MIFEDKMKGEGHVKVLKRNYLYTSIPAYSICKSTVLEKICSEGKINVFIATWNMNVQKPQIDFKFNILSGSKNVPDLIAIGTQETYTCNLSKWESTIQNIVGPTYSLRTKKQLGKLYIVLFLKEELVCFCSELEIDTILLNKYSIFKTKGVIALAFVILGTSFLFLTTHLSPHQKHFHKRIQQLKKIIYLLNLPKKLQIKNEYVDITENFNYIFLFGDLNFRLNQSRKGIMTWLNNTTFSIKTAVNVQNDQLNTFLLKRTFLKRFFEAPITFPPTYKYNYGSQIFDTSYAYRNPAYTDRILYKTKTRKISVERKNPKIQDIKCLFYDSLRNVCSSDHKPVYGIYAVSLRLGTTK